jgi:hypothetical protein
MVQYLKPHYKQFRHFISFVFQLTSGNMLVPNERSFLKFFIFLYKQKYIPKHYEFGEILLN